MAWAFLFLQDMEWYSYNCIRGQSMVHYPVDPLHQGPIGCTFRQIVPGLISLPGQYLDLRASCIDTRRL